MQAQDQQFTDTSGIIVTERFLTFLHEYKQQQQQQQQDVDYVVDQDVVHNMTSSSTPTTTTTTQMLLTNYNEQIIHMIKNDKTTVYINFDHIMDYDSELAEAIELEYYRFEPFLRKAIKDYVSLEHHDYVYDVDRGTREFFISIYNISRIDKIRNLKTDLIGKLIAINGTVTRSSEVRPELFLGTFSCEKCATIHSGVEQQCTYTLPQVCRNTECINSTNSKFDCLTDQSIFIDWQRLRVQENADEIPPGSMPRCIDVILRNELVETAKAGDKIVFTGTLLVVPDVLGGSRIGENAVTGRSATSRGSNDMFSGVTVSEYIISLVVLSFVKSIAVVIVRG